jgi:hypothetical protein
VQLAAAERTDLVGVDPDVGIEGARCEGEQEQQAAGETAEFVQLSMPREGYFRGSARLPRLDGRSSGAPRREPSHVGLVVRVATLRVHAHAHGRDVIASNNNRDAATGPGPESTDFVCTLSRGTTIARPFATARA